MPASWRSPKEIISSTPCTDEACIALILRSWLSHCSRPSSSLTWIRRFSAETTRAPIATSNSFPVTGSIQMWSLQFSYIFYEHFNCYLVGRWKIAKYFKTNTTLQKKSTKKKLYYFRQRCVLFRSHHHYYALLYFYTRTYIFFGNTQSLQFIQLVVCWEERIPLRAVNWNSFRFLKKLKLWIESEEPNI